jgi:DMSO/TMAO reductase YedYZ molybdopterin-dependent catalytic subunit
MAADPPAQIELKPGVIQIGSARKASPGETGLMWGKSTATVVHERTLFNAESSRSALAHDVITALDSFYCRNHGPIPDIPIDEWRLSVDGLVTTPLSVTFEELTHRFSAHTVVATLQCAGNRRTGFNETREIVGEHPWGSGATSTAECRGARLSDALEAAGACRDDGLQVVFAGPGRLAAGVSGPVVWWFCSPGQKPYRRRSCWRER